MKMDHHAFQIVAAPAHGPRPAPLGLARLAVGGLFLLVAAPLVLLPLLVMGVMLAAVASATFVRDCVVYAAEVTVGRPATAAAGADFPVRS